MMRLAFVLLLASCGEEVAPESTQPPPVAPPRHVAVLGDSTAVLWPDKLQELRPDLHVESHAVNGAETVAIAGEQWALGVRPLHNVDVLIVLGGVNDVSHLLPIEEALGRLLGIYDDAVSIGLEVYAVVPLPYIATFAATYGQDYVDRMLELEAGVRDAAAPVVIDLVEEWGAHQEYYADNVHPNAIGQARIARELAAVIP